MDFPKTQALLDYRISLGVEPTPPETKEKGELVEEVLRRVSLLMRPIWSFLVHQGVQVLKPYIKGISFQRTTTSSCCGALHETKLPPARSTFPPNSKVCDYWSSTSLSSECFELKPSTTSSMRDYNFLGDRSLPSSANWVGEDEVHAFLSLWVRAKRKSKVLLFANFWWMIMSLGSRTQQPQHIWLTWMSQIYSAYKNYF